MATEDDDEYFLPLEDQRVFGAGIRRKRVPFVRSSELNTTDRTSSAPPPSTAPGPSIANTYLSIVLGKDKNRDRDRDKAQGTSPSEQPNPPTTTQSAPSSPPSKDTPTPQPPPRCEVCDLPLETDPNSSSTSAPNFTSDQDEGAQKQYRPHEASLAHQVCLAHSHPPSHLDRSRHGLRYLSAYGWDPDSRRGLGAPGREGIREPLKGRLKVDTVGLGASVPSVSVSAAAAKKPAKVVKLNAKQVRRDHADSRRRGDRLREMFYQNDDVQRYLGGGG